MEIIHKEEGSSGEFYSELDGKRIGEIAYSLDGDGNINFEHTEVFDKEQGKGLGKELVKTGIDFAREKGYSVIATCPYANHVIQRNPEYRQLLKR